MSLVDNGSELRFLVDVRIGGTSLDFEFWFDDSRCRWPVGCGSRVK
jgi:hypothetical protein